MRDPNRKKLTDEGVAKRAELCKRLRDACFPLPLSDDHRSDIETIANEIVFDSPEVLKLWEHPVMVAPGA